MVCISIGPKLSSILFPLAIVGLPLTHKIYLEKNQVRNITEHALLITHHMYLYF